MRGRSKFITQVSHFNRVTRKSQRGRFPQLIRAFRSRDTREPKTQLFVRNSRMCSNFTERAQICTLALLCRTFSIIIQILSFSSLTPRGREEKPSESGSDEDDERTKFGDRTKKEINHLGDIVSPLRKSVLL